MGPVHCIMVTLYMHARRDKRYAMSAPSLRLTHDAGRPYAAKKNT
jgi:hypothetical protein